MTATNFGMARRTANGVDYNRINILLAILEKRCGYAMSRYDAYVNIAGGMKMNEPALDLAVVMALVSSFKNREVDPGMLIFGEVGLSGEVRIDLSGRRFFRLGNRFLDKCIPFLAHRTLSEPFCGLIAALFTEKSCISCFCHDILPVQETLRSVSPERSVILPSIPCPDSDF